MKIKIKNFQSVRDVNLDVDKFTVLVGKSNQGKTAICRAIEAALFGKLGKGFVSKGASHSVVKIDSPPDLSLEWRKGEKVNDMIIGDKHYQKLGRDLPKELAQLGIKELELEGKTLNINYADQFSPIFVINDSGSGSILASLLTEVSRVGKIHQASVLCSKDLKKDSSALTIKSESLEVNKREIERLEAIDQNLVGLDDAIAKAEELIKRKQSLEALVLTRDRMKKFKNLITKFREFHPYFEPLHLEKALSEINELKTLKEGFSKHKKLIFPKIAKPAILDKISSLNVLDSCLSIKNSLSQNRVAITTVRKELKDLGLKVSSVSKERMSLEKQLVICPVCEKPFEVQI